MKYTVSSLKKIAAGDKAIACAAQEAIRLIEYSGTGKGEKLDLSMETYDYLPISLMMEGVEKRKAGVDKEQIRLQLAHMAASYELFTLCNFLNTTGEAVAEIDMQLPRTPDPVLSITVEGKKTIFDLFALFRQCRHDCFVFPMQGVAVELNAVRKKIQTELFEKL